MNKKYDRYLNPDAMADEEFPSQEEISSHSSLLTNRRLDVMFARLDEVRVEAWSNTCIPTIRSYFAVVSGIYNNVYPIFELDAHQKIINYFNLYHQLFFKLYGDPEEVNKLNVCYQILLLLDHIQRMIIGSLQQKQFFFRLNKPQIKGIKQALALYENQAKEVKNGRTNKHPGSVPAMAKPEYNSPGEIKDAILQSDKTIPKEQP